MTMTNNNISNIAKKACLEIFEDEKSVLIKHKFRLGDKSILGLIFFLFGGVFLIIAPFIKTSDTTSKIIGIVLGLLFVIFSVFALIGQVVDGLQIKDNIVTFRYNLKRTIIPLSGNIKVKMKTEFVEIRRVGTLGSEFIVVTHFLHDQNKETPILKFQMDDINASNARNLGNEITRIINARIQLSIKQDQIGKN